MALSGGPSARGSRPLRIGIGGLHIEASTFSPHRTGLEDFRITRGAELLARYAWTEDRPTWAEGVEWVPTLHAVALPGGPLQLEAYRALRAELLERTAAARPLDGYLLDIHGAMSVEGMRGAEEDFVGGLRELFGPQVLLSAAMDLHGNVSATLAGLLDLATCFRTAPHEDAWPTRERAARLLVGRLRGGGRPKKAWLQVPVLLPGEKTSTRDEPARGIYGLLPEIEQQPGVIDAAVWVGYAWADEPRCRAAVLVSGDDERAITAQAERLASAYWQARERFSFVAPAAELDVCLDQALASAARPFFISDSGDNPTAGGAGDVSYALAHLLDRPQLAGGEVRAIYASLVDPEAVREAFRHQVGEQVELSVGGKIDAGPSGPVPLAGVLEAAVPGNADEPDMAVVRRGGLACILTARRKPFHRLADFSRLGLDVASAHLVVVKIGYLEPELYAAAAGWLLALTPGGVDQHLPRLGYRHLERPIYPLDPGMAAPELRARLL